ncbi:MAG TPA: 8-oxo-dGTP diphosphatase [Kofleriaceae bacterium]|nr:8-oxo-dGTP diphosphatase [Kofleriaceae bacterium]
MSDRFNQIRWDAWSPRERATLLYVIRNDQILLIRKKRGLGAGKINAPGGRVHDDEAPDRCAVREVQEELEVTPVGVEERAELSYQFVDGYSLHVHAFVARDCMGHPQETAEAAPLWVPIEDIPYDQMWADDRIWMPLVLAGQRVRGWFLFEGDTLLGHRVTAGLAP